MSEAHEERPDRMYPSRPLVGVGAVVLHNDHVLLVRRGRPPRRGMWTFPGGLVEVGETVFEAARRELREETGVDAAPIDVVDVYEVIDRDADGRVRYHFVIVEVLMQYRGGTPRPGDDAAAVAWVPLRDLATADVGPGVARVVARARARWERHPQGPSA